MQVAAAEPEYHIMPVRRSGLFLPVVQRPVSQRYLRRAPGRSWEEGDVERVKRYLAESSVWHTSTRLKDGREGLLVDPGAHDNLMGSETARRIDAALKASNGGRGEYFPLSESISVEGVGAKAQVCTGGGKVPITCENGDRGFYNAPIVPNSEIPALFGLKGLKRNAAIIDIGNDVMYFVAPGKVTLQLPPGSSRHKLVVSPSGHLILPMPPGKKVDNQSQTYVEVIEETGSSSQ